MKGQNISTLTIYLFYISATLWGFTEQEEVTGLFSKDCLLPCSFPPENDVVIRWHKGGKCVHSYYHQKDWLADSSEYINRTQLFCENIPGGNTSLKICNLTVTDEGTYECCVGTTQNSTNQKVMLHATESSCSWTRNTLHSTEKTPEKFAPLWQHRQKAENSSNTWKIVLGVGVPVAVVLVAGCCLYIKASGQFTVGPSSLSPAPTA